MVLKPAALLALSTGHAAHVAVEAHGLLRTEACPTFVDGGAPTAHGTTPAAVPKSAVATAQTPETALIDGLAFASANQLQDLDWASLDRKLECKWHDVPWTKLDALLHDTPTKDRTVRCPDPATLLAGFRYDGKHFEHGSRVPGDNRQDLTGIQQIKCCGHSLWEKIDQHCKAYPMHVLGGAVHCPETTDGRRQVLKGFSLMGHAGHTGDALTAVECCRLPVCPWKGMWSNDRGEMMVDAPHE